ncbi:extensin [Streptomyces sp. NPDC089919]|uniref:extensin n=1 Tax=Streptomyces sp. NPDC089919 TaxID=3155188 RepID=UPI0034214313
MADDRYGWLDGAAAEKLLSGEPVLPGDGHPGRPGAARLAHALDSLVPAARPEAELPGEAAALAAFRAARTADTQAREAAEPTVRLAPTAPAGAVELRPLTGPVRAPRRAGAGRRPLRLGLAAAVAGLTIGGVAAAATTGLLPGQEVRAGAGPSATVSVLPSQEFSRVAPEPTGGTGERFGTRRLPDPPVTGAPSGTTGPEATATAGTGTPSEQPEPKKTGGTDAGGTTGGGAEARRRLIDNCKDLRAGHLDGIRRTDLEGAARGDRVERFCDRLLGTGTGTGGTGDGDSAGKGGGKDDGKDKGKGGKKGGSTPLGFTPHKAAPTAPVSVPDPRRERL